jgi:TPR repeat protein
MTATVDPFSEERAAALREFQSGNISNALERFLHLAQSGDAQSMARAGMCYLRFALKDIGAERQRNVELAEFWFREALSAAAMPEANLVLGQTLTFFDSRPETKREGIEHLEIAAACGDARAMTFLGLVFKNGIGVEKSLDRARRLLETASGNGFVWPQLVLARLYKEQGRYLKSWLLTLSATRTGIDLARRNPNDHRLWGAKKLLNIDWFLRHEAQLQSRGTTSRWHAALVLFIILVFYLGFGFLAAGWVGALYGGLFICVVFVVIFAYKFLLFISRLRRLLADGASAVQSESGDS